MGILFTLIRWAIRIFDLMLLIHCVASWVRLAPNPVTDFIDRIVEPVLSPVRRVLARYVPALTAPVDWTPAVVMVLLYLISALI